jgi:NTE family protein
MTDTPRRINLALQGGGSHGALTWGVLDRVLEDPRLAIGEISGTSAGAMNAVALADGYQRDGREGARASLRRFWKAVSDSTRYSPIRRGLWDRLWGRYSLDYSPGYLMAESLGRVFSPYDLNPLGLNPLRDLLLANVDFANVNACEDIQVHVTATNVRTGRAKIFSRGAVTADAVLASACLPQMSPAVEIEGEAYWDGGFSGNPALQPLVESRVLDMLIVQINPVVRHDVPRSAREIINRVNEISFNSSLLKELRTLNLFQRLMAIEGVEPGAKRSAFIHLIHVDDDVQDLAASSKLNAEWDYLQLLFERGRRWADTWLDANFDAIGQRSTFDLDELFEEPKLRPAGTRRLIETEAEAPVRRRRRRAG